MAASKTAQSYPILQGSSAEATEMQPVLQQFLTELEQLHMTSYNLKLSEVPAYRIIKERNAGYKGRLVLATAEAINRSHNTPKEDYQLRHLLEALLQQLLRSTLELSAPQWQRVFEWYGLVFEDSNNDSLWRGLMMSPVLLTLIQVGKHAQKNGLDEGLRAYLTQLKDATKGYDDGYGSATAVKIRVKVQELLGQEGGADALPAVVFTDADPFGQHLNQQVQALDPAATTTPLWLRLFQLWQKASGGQPTAKYRKEVEATVAALGPETVRTFGQNLLQVLSSIKAEEKTHTNEHNGRSYSYTTWEYLQEPSLTVGKGLIWTLQPLADTSILLALADLAAKSYRKIPGKGPMAASLGNACLLVLSQCGLPGVSALARVRAKIKQTNTQELIARYIDKASKELGVSPEEIEDMAMPDFGLKDGQAVSDFGEYTATLLLADGKAEVQWQKAGKPLKTAPTALKATHAAELKELKNNQTLAQQTYTALRDRLDRSFVSERRIPWPWFEQYYLRHGLMSELARPLIWRLHRPDGSFQDVRWLNEAWHDAHGQPQPAPTAETTLQLWHPVLAPPAEVLAWRAVLEAAQLRQPLKQAFREVYLLTPPEERTRTYSNRMAAHILKQHQFSSLAKLRGWKYRLLGAYDKGYDSETATLALPLHGLQAEFWVSEVNADGAWNDTGIYNYVSTDQVRFTRGTEAVPLPEIPPLVFSEVMRDVDLFVGVGSVGNDPAWRDNGGLAQYRNYWESYSFGELGEVAKNRKLALERLVPRLKIGKVSEIKDKFLVVRGKVRTYKIHLGSGNILMEPNDQYLCIVPDRSAKPVGATDIFLPFEGDGVLSIILSKAALLMDDDKITDETILRQIGR
jgi:hypothetical protein